MGRPRAFDEVAVLDASVEQFRMHGFADTSTDQLCEAAGVGRSSLYNTFTSKDELFVRSLERAVSVSLKQQKSILTDQALSGRQRLGVLLTRIVDEEHLARTNGHAAGCMIVATRMSPDIGIRDPRVGTLLDRFRDEQLSLLAVAVSVGQIDGTLRVDVSPQDGALMIASAISGIRVLSQSDIDGASLNRVAQLHIESLRM